MLGIPMLTGRLIQQALPQVGKNLMKAGLTEKRACQKFCV